MAVQTDRNGHVVQAARRTRKVKKVEVGGKGADWTEIIVSSCVSKSRNKMRRLEDS